MTSPALLGAFVSFLVCLALTPAARRLCTHYGAVDRPGPLKIHTRPVPRLGGIAIALSIAAGIVIPAGHGKSTNTCFFAGLATIWLAGLADDLWNISPYIRLATQIVSGTLIWAGGWRFASGNLLPQTGLLSAVFVCGLIVLLTNSWNFWDGSDGLAAGVCAIVGGFYILVCNGFPLPPITASIAASLTGACVAFLFYNLPPAAVFLGDSGSTLLGLSVALLALRPPHAASLAGSLRLAPLLIALLPITDAALAVLRRIRAGASPLTGDRFHAYDLMLARGWPSRTVALVCYSITALLGCAAWIGVRIGTRGFLVIVIACVSGVLLFDLWLGALGSARRSHRAAHVLKFRARNETRSSS